MKEYTQELTESQLREYIGRPVHEVIGFSCHTFYPLVNTEGIIVDVISIDADMEGLELVDDNYLVAQDDDE
jgi:hypothetical protein